MEKRFAGRNRLLVQAALLALGLGVIAIPGLAVGLSGTASSDPLWTTLRVAALEAFSLIFCNIVTGAFRPLFNRVFKPRGVHRFHTATGVTGFSLAVAHGTMAFFFGISGYRPVAVWVGPTMLALLLVAILTVLTRGRLRRSWRWIHRLNYLIFAGVLLHGSLLGSDLRSGMWLRICFWIYAAVVVAGIAYRLAAGQKRGKVRA